MPTQYDDLPTNQFSVTSTEKPIDPSVRGDAHGHSHNAVNLPGVFFTYDISPILVRYRQERRRSLSDTLTSLCAIVGGVVSAARLSDALVYQSIVRWRKHVELGKGE